MKYYEIFNSGENWPMRQVGSMEAPNAETAHLFSIDYFGRRMNANKIWVVPRDAIIEFSDIKLEEMVVK